MDSELLPISGIYRADRASEAPGVPEKVFGLIYPVLKTHIHRAFRAGLKPVLDIGSDGILAAWIQADFLPGSIV